MSTGVKIGGNYIKYIGDKITDGTNGRVSGLVQVYYNSAQEHFIGNAAVASTMPPCP